MTVIDTYIHVLVPEITRAVCGDDWCPDVQWVDGRQIVEFEGKRINSALREFVNSERILAEQVEAGVDKALLTPWSSLFAYDIELQDALTFNQIQNDALARMVQQDGIAARVNQPFLVVFGKLDRLIPYQHAERLAAEAPKATLVMYEDGNHVVNNYPFKYRPLVADWVYEELTK